MKIIAITDLHYDGLNNMNKKFLLDSKNALNNLENLLNNLDNENLEADLIVFLGDNIYRNKNHSNNLKNISDFKNLLDKSDFDYSFLLGNHELVFNEKETYEYFDIKKPYYQKIINDYQLLFLDTVHGEFNNYHTYIDDEQLNWLEYKLKKDYKQTIIFSHVPLYKFDITDYPWFKDFEYKVYIQNYNELNKLLKSKNKKIYMVNGHVHQNQIHQDKDLTFVSLNSFVKTSEDKFNPKIDGSYLEIDIDNNIVDIKYKQLK